MVGRRLVFRVHALQRMLERQISVDDVWWILESGETMAEYSDDRPIPSRLVLGWVLSKPLHVVAADEKDCDITAVISVYRPDPKLWYPGWSAPTAARNTCPTKLRLTLLRPLKRRQTLDRR